MGMSAVIDVFASLALLALLAESYGAVRRRLVGSFAAPIVLGVLFGLLSVVQMLRPFEPFDGVLIDLRNIPIALAGAFLGWRGLLPALGIALLTRLELGGVGAVAGAFGMLIAGLAGMIWARKMVQYHGRTFMMLVCLALAMSSHLLAAVILPHHKAVWFFTNAAGPLLAVNLIVVPLIGLIMERENRRLAREMRSQNAINHRPMKRALKGPAFGDAVKLAFATRPFGAFGGFLILGGGKNAHLGFFQRLLPRQSVTPSLPDAVLRGLLEHDDLIGQSADGRLFVPLSDVEVARGGMLLNDMCDGCAIRQSKCAPRLLRRLSCEAQILPVPDPSQFLRIVEEVSRSTQQDWPRAFAVDYAIEGGRRAKQMRRAKIFDPNKHDTLFAKADYLIDRGRN